MKRYLFFISFLIVQISVKAQTLQAGIYSGGRYYIPNDNEFQSFRVNQWANDFFLRWEPKGKISFETAFTTFERTDYGEVVNLLEYPYSGQILAKGKGIYSEYYLVSGWQINRPRDIVATLIYTSSY